MAGLTRITAPNGAPFTVAAPYAPQFQGLLQDLQDRGYLADPAQSGGYANRNIAGTSTPSFHKFGRAVDINWTDNARGTQGAIPPGVARTLANKHGLTWGGDWKNPDPMHFEASGRGNAVLPVSQRGLLSFAGHPQAPVSGLAGGDAPRSNPQAPPMTTGSLPTPTPQQSAPMAQPTKGPGLIEALMNPLTMAGMAILGDPQRDVGRGLALGGRAANDIFANQKQQRETEQFQGLLAQMGPEAGPYAQMIGQLGPEKGTPLLLDLINQKRQRAMEDEKWGTQKQLIEAQTEKARRDAATGGDQPMSVKEWEYFSKLPAPQQQQYLTMKRAEKYLDTGMEYVQPNAANPAAPPVRTVPKNPAEVERQKEIGGAMGKQDAAAPSDLAAADAALELIGSIRTDPNRERGTGASAVGNMVPATRGFDFQKKVDQAKSGAFLTAIQQLRGMGALSNAEGQTATAAVTRMSTAMTEEGFLEALNDYEKTIKAGRERALARTMRGAPMYGNAPTADQPAPAAAPSLPQGWSVERLP